MGRLLDTELQKYVESSNGPNMLQQMYLYLHDQFPALVKEECAYQKDTALYIHAVGSTESNVAFAMFVAWDFDISSPDIQSGHFCMYVAPKVHQLLRLLKFIEANYPDECSETLAWLEQNKEQRKAEVDATISAYVERHYERVS